MRRSVTGLIPVVMLITCIGAAGAQTRTAPSIGDAVRRAPSRVITQPGVSTRGVDLPRSQRCDNDGDRDDRDYRYDGRYDRNKKPHPANASRNNNGKYGNGKYGDRKDEGRNGNNGQGCCVVDQNGRNTRVYGNGNGTGTGTVDTRRTNGGVTNGGVWTNGSGTGTVRNGTGVQRNQDGCGYDDRRDDRGDDKRRDQDRRDHDFDRDRRDDR